MSKNHLKSFVENIVREAILKEMVGGNLDADTATTRLTPNQKQVVAALMQRKFRPVKYIDAGNNQVSVVLEQPYRKAADEGNRFAHVTPNGRINRDQLDLRTFLKSVVGEVMFGQKRDDHRFDDGREPVMGFVNVEESNVSKKEGDTVQVADGSGIDSGKIGVIVPTKFRQTGGGLIPDEPGAYKPQPKGWLSVKFEDGHVASFPANRLQIPFSFLKGTDKALKEDEERECDCGSGLPSEWALDGRGIPLVRVCDRCRKKKLARYRPEILRPYTQADVDEPIEPDEYDEQTGTGAVAGYSTPFAFKKKKVKERILPDGKYEDDMESALQSKRVSGMSETVSPPYDAELDIHGKPCPCGSGLPSFVKLSPTGKVLARVCRKCDKWKQKTLKDFRSNKRRGRSIPRKLKISEIANFEMGLVATASGIMIYKILRNIIDSLAANRDWKNRRLTPYVIDAIFKSVKKRNPGLNEEELYYFKQEVSGLITSGEIRTVNDLKHYFETKKLEEANKRSIDYPIVKKVKNAAQRFFKTTVERIQIAYKNTDNDIVFEIYLGPDWIRKFVRFHGLNRPFEVWDEGKKKFIPTNMLVRNFPPVEEAKELSEIVGFGTGVVVGFVSAFLYRLLKDIFKVMSNKHFKNMPLTDENIDLILRLGRKRNPSLDEEQMEYMRNIIMTARNNGVKTVGELFVYLRKLYHDESLKEMTGTGAVAGYDTPFAFTKHKDGSKRALDVTKKLGFKVAKSISEEENILT